MTEYIKHRLSALANANDANQLRWLFNAALVDLTAVRTKLAAAVVDMTAMRARQNLAMISPVGLVQGSSTPGTCKTTYAIQAIVNGTFVYLPAATEMSVLPAQTVTQGNFGLFAFYIDAAGTITTSTAVINAATAAAAYALLPALPANKVQLGFIIVTDSNSAFVSGTDALNASGVTTIYVDNVGIQSPLVSLTTSAPAALTLAA